MVVVIPKKRSVKPCARKESCDIGYALAVDSYERVGSMDTCTVAAFDVITVFAVPNLSGFSQSRRFFRVWLYSESPRATDHPAYFGPVTCSEHQPFQPSTP